MRLAGLSDKIILAVAHRRSQGLPVLSGEKLGELKNTGVTDAMILEMIQKGDSDETATKFIAAARTRRRRPQIRLPGACPQIELRTSQTSRFHFVAARFPYILAS